MQIHVFYGHQYLGNETTIDQLKKVPDGAFILMNNRWYTQFHGSLTSINKVDLPKEIQVQLLILDIKP